MHTLAWIISANTPQLGLVVYQATSTSNREIFSTFYIIILRGKSWPLRYSFGTPATPNVSNRAAPRISGPLCPDREKFLDFLVSKPHTQSCGEKSTEQGFQGGPSTSVKASVALPPVPYSSELAYLRYLFKEGKLRLPGSNRLTFIYESWTDRYEEKYNICTFNECWMLLLPPIGTRS